MEREKSGRPTSWVPRLPHSKTTAVEAASHSQSGRPAEPLRGESKPARPKRSVVFPLVRSKRPGTLRLTGKRIAEILDEEDASPQH